MFKTICKMFYPKIKQTAGETAKTLVVFRDCHASTRIAVQCTGRDDERFVRSFARHMGWPVCVRKGGAA